MNNIEIKINLQNVSEISNLTGLTLTDEPLTLSIGDFKVGNLQLNSQNFNTSVGAGDNLDSMEFTLIQLN